MVAMDTNMIDENFEEWGAEEQRSRGAEEQRSREKAVLFLFGLCSCAPLFVLKPQGEHRKLPWLRADVQSAVMQAHDLTGKAQPDS